MSASILSPRARGPICRLRVKGLPGYRWVSLLKTNRNLQILVTVIAGYFRRCDRYFACCAECHVVAREH